jgi:hypothetical protein
MIFSCARRYRTQPPLWHVRWHRADPSRFTSRSYLDTTPAGRVIAQAQAHHGTCTTEYYQQALARVGADAGTRYYVVLRNNLEWARSRIDLPGASTQFVADRVQCTDVQEMMMMAPASTTSFSNSTFSWWGAWLASHPAKVVVAPRRVDSGAAVECRRHLSRRMDPV